MRVSERALPVVYHSSTTYKPLTNQNLQTSRVFLNSSPHFQIIKEHFKSPKMSAAVIWALTSFALFMYIVVLKTSVRKRKIRVREGNYQVVIVVNRDLKMSPGKAFSQVGHAVDGMHEVLVEYPDLMRAWRRSGSAKIVVRGTQNDLQKVYLDAREAGLLHRRVFDAGRTQVAPGSYTCVLVGPATKEELEPVTGHLSLY